ncbi:MAG: hypothetical protein ACR2LI_10445 [Propionibacteriaceae bacterium]
MSPRAAATRQDETALKFLHAAAELIDASMLASESAHPRLRQIKFPAALDWIRVEDVLLVATQQHDKGISKKAFLNRWPTREEFLRDAVVFAMLYRDLPDSVRPDPDVMASVPGSGSFSAGVGGVIENLVDTLTDHPRSFLLCYLAPYLPRHPETANYVREAAEADLARWTYGYTAVLDALGVRPRPDWPMERITLALQCVLDGFVLRHRVQPALMDGARWHTASLMADTVVAFLGGALDFERTGVSSRDAVDGRAAAAAEH